MCDVGKSTPADPKRCVELGDGVGKQSKPTQKYTYTHRGREKSGNKRSVGETLAQGRGTGPAARMAEEWGKIRTTRSR